MAGHDADEEIAADIWVNQPNELPPRFVGLRLNPRTELKRLDDKDVWVWNVPNPVLVGAIVPAGKLVKSVWSLDAGVPASLPGPMGAKEASSPCNSMA